MRLWRRRQEEALAEEIRQHIETETQLNIERGMTPEEAQSAALRRFGNVTRSEEESRAVWRSAWLEQLLQDLRYALRIFLRNPAFSITTILVIAIGIGASASVFSAVDRILFRSLPYADGDRLITVGINAPILEYDFLFANDHLYLRQMKASPFATVTSWTGVADCDLTEERPLQLTCGQVEANFLPTLGISPLIGRNFMRDEDRPNTPKVALISYRFWRSRYGGKTQVLGQLLSVDGTPTRIIGVLPPDFEFPSLAHIDLLVPQALAITEYRPGQSSRALRVIGRLKPGVSLERAWAELRPFFKFQLEEVPSRFRKEVRPAVKSLRDYQIGNVKLASWFLLGGTIAILLIVCANVANLLLARSFTRERELAVRASLGAGRGRLIRQTFTESLTLSVLGGLAGCGLAYLLLQIFKSLAPNSLPRLQETAIDGRALFFAFGMAVLSGILFGLAPALVIPPSQKLTARTALGNGSRLYLRQTLAGLQLALSLVLLSVSGLLLQSLWKLQSVASGVQSEHVTIADVSVSFKRYLNSATRQQFFDELMDRLRRLPGVSAVAVSDTVPPAGFVKSRPLSNFVINGRAVEVAGTGGMVVMRSVTPEYFKALGIPVLRGRSFLEEERSSKDNTLIISNSLAKRLFPAENAMNAVLKLYPQSPDYLVIGVAADVHNNGLASQTDPEYYVLRKRITDPNAGRNANIMDRSVHFYDGQVSVIVRSAARPDVTANWIRSELARLDPTTPVTITTMNSRLRTLSERPRFSATLLSAFAAIGLLLAAFGLYGLVSFLVVQRTGEIGLRMAVGATPAQITKFVFAQALRWTTGGLLAGLAGSILAARSLRSLLFEVQPENPILFGGAALTLILVALAATVLPGLRAARIDPVTALRQE